MAVKIYKNVAKPPLLLFGDPVATIINLIAGSISYYLMEVIIIALAMFCIMQGCIFYLTYTNPYYFTQKMMSYRSIDQKAITKEYEGEIYVA